MAIALLVTALPLFRSRWQLQLSGTVVSIVVSLSALSPYLYTIFLPDLARRYLLVLIMMMVVMVCLLLHAALSLRGRWSLPHADDIMIPPRLTTGTAASWPATWSAPRGAMAVSSRAGSHPSSAGSSVRKRWFIKEEILAILLLTLLGASLIGPYASLAARDYALAYEKRFPIDRLAAELLPRLNHTNGLSDFWGANLGMLSGGRLDVQPIHANGEPDLWAHNREAFLAASREPDRLPVKNYTFVYLREEEGNGLSEEEIIRSYGEPVQRIGC
jgi:hypothetical protein